MRKKAPTRIAIAVDRMMRTMAMTWMTKAGKGTGKVEGGQRAIGMIIRVAGIRTNRTTTAHVGSTTMMAMIELCA